MTIILNPADPLEDLICETRHWATLVRIATDNGDPNEVFSLLWCARDRLEALEAEIETILDRTSAEAAA